MNRLSIPYVEFYIINVCNLGCNGCNRFNNYKFTGYQRWDEYKDVYTQWADQVDLQCTAILGGEPTLNPTFLDWVDGITALWPTTFLKIFSNGFKLDKWTELYSRLRNNPKIQLNIGIHNKQHKKELIQKVKNFTTAPHKVEFNSDNPYQQYMTITDANDVQIRVEYNWWFHQGAIINVDGIQKLHESDPIIAHNNCHMKYCHHFIKGKLYKCGVVALLPEYDLQHPLMILSKDRDLMMSYKPLTIDHTIDQKMNFINNLSDHIDQCKFCPEEYNGIQIYARKK